MPHFDGSGPTGRGPFTGSARGYCALRVEDEPEGALVGFIGKQGEPFSRPPHLPEDTEGDAPLLRAPLHTLDGCRIWRGGVRYACWRSNRPYRCWATNRAWRWLLFRIEHTRLRQCGPPSAGPEPASGRTLAATVSQMAARPAWSTATPLVALIPDLSEQNLEELEEQTMPRGDQRGPRGMGPMTGRGAGFCAGYDVPGYANPGPGFGRGMGGWAAGRGGGGRGWRHWYYATGVPGWMRYGAQPWEPDVAAPQQAAGSEREALKAELDGLQERLNAIRGQIDKLDEQSE
jgi:hypothetical protein